LPQGGNRLRSIGPVGPGYERYRVCQADERRQGQTVAGLQERVADSAAPLSLIPQHGRGNAGPVGRVENQTQVFHSSHRPLEISQTPRDFHIPTATACIAWKSGKPKNGFPLSHAMHATTTTVSLSQTQPQRKEVGRCAASSPTLLSGSSCIGIKPGFRIIRGLENARGPHGHSSLAGVASGFRAEIYSTKEGAMGSNRPQPAAKTWRYG